MKWVLILLYPHQVFHSHVRRVRAFLMLLFGMILFLNIVVGPGSAELVKSKYLVVRSNLMTYIKC